MKHRALVPGFAGLVFLFLMSWAKDNAPWAIFFCLVLAFLACAFATMYLDSVDRAARRAGGR
jgi:hypothetical protein